MLDWLAYAIGYGSVAVLIFIFLGVIACVIAFLRFPK